MRPKRKTRYTGTRWDDVLRAGIGLGVIAPRVTATCAGLALLCLGFCRPGFAEPANESANELVRRVVANELKAESQDNSHWLYRLRTEKPNAPEEVEEVIQTKDGEIKRPLLINGKQPTDEQQRRGDAQLQDLLHHPEKLHKSQRDAREDEERSARLLQMLPQAFLFQYGERQGDVVQLNFKPNPRFIPPSREAKVFHAMEGSIRLDVKENRLAEISGHLTHEVKFGGGVLGHLDKGGQFYVKQERVAPGFWELTALNVEMNGKALFFKTISVRQKYFRSDFRKVSDDLTVAQGIRILREQPGPEQAQLRQGCVPARISMREAPNSGA